MRGPKRALAVLVILALTACSPTLDWRTVRPEGALGLEAAFPCKPDKLDRELKIPGLDGPPVLMHLLSCKTDQTTWALSYFDAKDIRRVSPALSLATQSLRDNLKAQADDLGAVSIKGMTPHPLARHWRFLGKKPSMSPSGQDLAVHTWHFTNGMMVFQASVWRSITREHGLDFPPELETFANGLNFSE